MGADTAQALSAFGIRCIYSAAGCASKFLHPRIPCVSGAGACEGRCPHPCIPCNDTHSSLCHADIAFSLASPSPRTTLSPRSPDLRTLAPVRAQCSLDSCSVQCLTAGLFVSSQLRWAHVANISYFIGLKRFCLNSSIMHIFHFLGAFSLEMFSYVIMHSNIRVREMGGMHDNVHLSTPTVLHARPQPPHMPLNLCAKVE